ncbi:hypothetical protein N9D63_07315 [Opitutales bacterium]|jgi:hypothetical protein|nr:hypothetical protein [Opitutales bacterium]
MGLSKSERRVAIWVGVGIGVAVSSMLVRVALQKKNEQMSNLPGNFDSLRTAVGGKPFPSVPTELRERFSNAVVVHYEGNASGHPSPVKNWVIESAGSFRSERLFVLVEESTGEGNGTSEEEPPFRFHRASEAQVTLKLGVQADDLKAVLDEERFQVIGTNSQNGNPIVQFRDISPLGIRKALAELKGFAGLVDSAALSPFPPPPRQISHTESR